MTQPRRSLSELRREHPVFFWGTVALAAVLLLASAAVALRVPSYQREASAIGEQMTEAERRTRDQILESRAQRTQLAVALLQRELRLKSMEEKGVHLAVNTEDSTLALRHGPATLRQVRVHIGPDSVIRAPDGRTWRFVRPLGERHLQAREASPTYTIPEWYYLGSGEPVPPEGERRMKGALGQYVLRLDDGTEIYSQPEVGPYVEQVKPAAFMVDEQDLRAIFDAVKADIPVYIY